MYMLDKHVHGAKILFNRRLSALYPHHVHVYAKFRKSYNCNLDIAKSNILYLFFRFACPSLLIRFKSASSPFH